jgi:uncharacterized protein with HEPN domain
MPPSAEDRLVHILERIKLIERAIDGMTYDQFADDEIIMAAVERFLAVICEASIRLPEETKRQAPAIDWRRMNNFANLLRHAYHSAKPDEVWQIVQDHLPPLKAFVESQISE